MNESEIELLLKKILVELEAIKSSLGIEAARKIDSRYQFPTSDEILIIEHLNHVTKKRFKATNPATRDLIKARLSEGFSLEDFKRVIDARFLLWGSDPSMSQYLRPETLFGPKFESYLNSNDTKGLDHEAFWR